MCTRRHCTCTHTNILMHIYTHMSTQGNLVCTGCTGCATLTTANGTVSDSASGPSDYSDNSQCQWILAPTGAARVTITFSEFSTENLYDYMDVYQCTTIQCILGIRLGRLSGTYASPQTFTSTTGYMLLYFFSDGSVRSTGFTAQWTSGSESVTPAPTPASSPVSVSDMYTRVLFNCECQ
jgi:hypothetical protein